MMLMQKESLESPLPGRKRDLSQAGTQSSHFPGRIWDEDITPQWAQPSRFAKCFHSLSELPDHPVRQSGWAGHFSNVNTEDQTGHAVCPRPRCKKTAVSNETLGFSGQRPAFQLGFLLKSQEINFEKSLLSYSSVGPEMTISFPNSTE